MKWVDIAGPPGSGKSSISYPLWADRSVTWDGLPPPAYWKLFLDEITTLMGLVQDHVDPFGRPTIEAVVRMNDRSAKKMATVERMQRDDCFIQTGLVQRILGFGWRLHDMGRDVNLIRTALWRMPVSAGVVFLEADEATIIARNKARRLNPETAHEDRSFQIAPMRPAIAVAKEVLRERGVPVLELDVQHQSIDAARGKLLAFADQGSSEPPQVRSCREVPLLSPPSWWR